MNMIWVGQGEECNIIQNETNDMTTDENKSDGIVSTKMRLLKTKTQNGTQYFPFSFSVSI